jgi:ADP-ribosyl-[dinitrogen reductase] hydrolase
MTNPQPPNERSRYRGALLGLATGDAVGTTVEFRAPGSFEPVTDLVGGGPFHLEAGQWTDDTSMALCLADSLIERRGFDPADQMRRYVQWYRVGYRSSTGACFDIGGTVRAALHCFEATGDPFCGPTDPNTAGNGSLMRLAPVPLFFSNDPAEAIEKSAESSRTTHGTREAVDACRYFAALLVGALGGASKEEILSTRFSPLSGYWEQHPLAPAVDEIAAGSFRRKEPPQIRGSGYVIHSLEAALWAFSRTADFREGCLRAVNLGEDADTTAAIYGQLAGAYYGASAIPEAWRAQLAMREEITRLADALLELRAPAPGA